MRMPDMKLNAISIVGLMLAAGCGPASTSAYTFTLYRNSGLDRSMRVHWATFDAEESDRNYNRNNCDMAARLLIANVDASAEQEGKPRDPTVGFWCEPGSYSDEGAVPSSFPAAFPTDV